MKRFEPTRFGKYLLLNRFALGGMAELYRAKITGEEGFEKLIAIKKILPHLATQEELIRSFIDEAKLAALLHHSNIIQVYDFGSIENGYFITMEYLFGKDLNLFINRSKEKGQPFPLEYALFIVSRICAGLDYAHKRKDLRGKPLNLIHRDISPQNIFLTYEGEVKLVDFGIAKAAIKSSVTNVGMIKGKVAYMSPEQAAGKPIDHRSDIFSTGILLYEMVTGKRMFEGDTLHILSRVCEAKFDPPVSVADTLSPKLYEILDRSLAKEPEQRYQSCGEMLADLEAAKTDFSVGTTSRGFSQHIKKLFEKEMAYEEQQILREVAWVETAGESEADGGKTLLFDESGQQKTPAAVTHRPERRSKKKLPKKVIFSVAGSILFLMLLGFLLFPSQEEKQVSEMIVKTPQDQAAVQIEGKAEGVLGTDHSIPPTTPDQASQEAATSEKADADVILESKDSSSTPLPREETVPIEKNGATTEMVVKTPQDQAAVQIERKAEGVLGTDHSISPTKSDRASQEAATSEKADADVILESKDSSSTPLPREETVPIEKNGSTIVHRESDFLAQAQQAFEARDYEKALPLFEQAFEQEPSLKEKYGSKVYDIYVGLGKDSIGKSDTDAVALLEKALDYKPKGEKALFYLGFTSIRLGISEKAEECFEKVIEQYPFHDKAHFNLGYLYLEQGDYAHAIKHFNKVIELEPDYLADAYINLGITYFKIDKYNLSKEAFSKVLEIDPNNDIAHKYLSYLE